MFCGGVTQFATNEFRWDFVPTNEEVEFANWIILIWMFAFSVIQKTWMSKKIRLKRTIDFNFNSEIFIESKKVPVLMLFLLLIGCFNVYKKGFNSLFMRSVFGFGAFAELFPSQSLQLLVLTLINGFSLWSFIVCVLRFQKRRMFSNLFLVVVAGLVCFLNVPPLGVARFLFAAAYGCVLLSVSSLFKKKRLLIYALLVGLLILFPFLNSFRGLYTTELSIELINDSLGTISDNFATADYDSYTMLVYTVRYVRVYGLTKGRQLLGVLLFFVPRSLWPTKPGGSGATIIETMATTVVNPNVSCPFIAEGYINFGILGVIIFALLMGKITKAIDNYYWRENNEKLTPLKLFYSFFVLFAIFFYRGDFLSSFSYLVGYSVSIELFAKLFASLSSRNKNIK